MLSLRGRKGFDSDVVVDFLRVEDAYSLVNPMSKNVVANDNAYRVAA